MQYICDTLSFACYVEFVGSDPGFSFTGRKICAEGRRLKCRNQRYINSVETYSKRFIVLDVPDILAQS